MIDCFHSVSVNFMEVSFVACKRYPMSNILFATALFRKHCISIANIATPQNVTRQRPPKWTWLPLKSTFSSIPFLHNKSMFSASQNSCSHSRFPTENTLAIYRPFRQTSCQINYVFLFVAFEKTASFTYVAKASGRLNSMTKEGICKCFREIIFTRKSIFGA